MSDENTDLPVAVEEQNDLGPPDSDDEDFAAQTGHNTPQ